MNHIVVFHAQKMPDLTENNKDRSKSDPFQIRESLVMKDGEGRYTCVYKKGTNLRPAYEPHHA